MRSTRTRIGATAFALTTALSISACDDEKDETAPSSVEGDSAPSPPEGSDDSDDDPTAAKDGSSSEGPTGAECLTGNWFVDNEEFGELMSTVSGTAVDDVQGTVMVTFGADGTTTTHYDEWIHSITVDGATVTIERNGSDSGTYEVAQDGTMTLTDTEMSSITESHMEVGGRNVTSTVPPQPSVFSQATFVCEADELTVTAEGATTTLHREH